MRYFIINIKISILSTMAISAFTLLNPLNSFAQTVKPKPAKIVKVQKKTVKKVATPANKKYHNFIKKHNPVLGKSDIEKIASNVTKYGKESHVSPELLLALMAKESSFRANVVSPVGAIGLGQLMRPTALEVGVSNPFNIVENIKGTARYLSKLLKHFNGNLDATLASYNMGPNAVANSISRGRKLPGSVYQYVAQIKTFRNTI
jgi:soluble lytic murein transglycosylase-like protein